MRFHFVAGLIAFVGGFTGGLGVRAAGVYAAGVHAAGVHAAGLVVAAEGNSVALTTDTGPIKPRGTIVTANTLPTSTVSNIDRDSTSVSISSSGPEPKSPILCPRDNNTYWIDHGRSRHAFKVQCGMDHYDPAHNWNFDKGMKNSWEECAMWCGEFNHCLGFSYIGGIPLKPNCWLKSNLSGEVENWNSWGGTWVGVSSYLDDHGDGDNSVIANTVGGPSKQTTTVHPVKIDTTTEFVQDTAFTTAVTTVVTTELVKPMAPATTIQVVPTSGSLSTPIDFHVTCTHDDWWADERAAWRAIEYFCEGGRDGTFGGQASDKILHEEDSFAAAYWPYNGTAVITSVGSLPGCTIKVDKTLCMDRFRSVMYGCDLDVKYQKRGGTVNDGCFAWSIHMQSWPNVGQCHDQDTDGLGLCAVWSTSYDPSDSTTRDGLKIDWFPRD
ncbi:hypothetical protein B0T20DRAFT_351188 [Sordaria brevicollis]|uniref:Apple domain-containing protein n=1 Tax=Sordaria brevicollis TaxID=83679 RepID=A0AAE0PGR0_SORBR|nr:hypothetical protein B0T20DRAFT_351188 [Sordaria brevicollis]